MRPDLCQFYFCVNVAGDRPRIETTAPQERPSNQARCKVARTLGCVLAANAHTAKPSLREQPASVATIKLQIEST